MDKCVDHGRTVKGFGYAKGSLNGVSCGLHRKVYCEYNGKTLADIKGLVVRHKCDNPRCINPLHLEIGTWQDNTDDMKSRGREVKLRGEDHALSKLSASDVKWIRENYIPRHKIFGVRAMARKLGVYHAVISRVVRGVGYR